MPAVTRPVLAGALLTVVLAGCSGGADPGPTPFTEPGSPATSQAATPTAPPTTNAPVATLPLSTLPVDTDACAALTVVTSEGSVNGDDVTEISGAVASRNRPGVLWVHNDSGGGAAVHAVATDGTRLATVLLDGVLALDWEDIAIGPGPTPDADYLYVGDIGDNFGLRPDLTVFRLVEPEPNGVEAATEIERLRVAYPDPGPDSEAIAVDPATGDLILVTKTQDGLPSVYRAPAARLGTEAVTGLERVAVLDLGDGAQVTAADFSPNGDRFVLRGYDEVWVWPRLDQDLTATLAAPPCLAASPDEVQGEAITFSADGASLYTVSEGTDPAVNRIGAP
jgi:hypothetical protein